MPTPTKGPRLGGSPQHQRLLLSNLATALFEHGRPTTTHANAQPPRPGPGSLTPIAEAARARLAAARCEPGGDPTRPAKAKGLRPVAERLITFAKRGDLHARRQVLT